MREIKFRAWDKKEKKLCGPQDEFTCGLVVLLGGFTEYGGCLDYSSEPCFDDFQWYNRKIVEERYILMQFTGHKDKTGTDIYEGDIVKTFAKWVSEICFGSFQSHMSGELNIGFYCKSASGTMRPMSTISSEFEIIGNIHQNPELLEQ